MLICRKMRPRGTEQRGGDPSCERAIAQVQAATTKLLAALPANGEPRTREGEKAKAKARWERRESAIRDRY